MYNYKFKILRPLGAKKMVLIYDCNFFTFVENWIYYDAIHNLSVWLRTCYNPADVNRFQSDTQIFIMLHIVCIEET